MNSYSNLMKRYSVFHKLCYVVMAALLLSVNDRHLWWVAVPLIPLFLFRSRQYYVDFFESIALLGAQVFVWGFYLGSFLNSRGNFLMALSLVALFILGKKPLVLPKTLFIKIYFVLFFAGLLWLLFCLDGFASWSSFISVNKGFASILLLLSSIKKPQDFQILLISFGVSLCLAFILLICGYTDYLNIKNTFAQLGVIRLRPVAMMSSVFFFSLFWYSGRSMRLPIYFVLFLVSSIIFIYLQSRMASLVCILILSVILLSKLRLRRSVFFCCFLLAGYSFLPKPFIENVKTSFATQNNLSNEARIVMWKTSLAMIKDNQIFGLGMKYRSTKKVMAEYIHRKYEGEQITETLSKTEFLKNFGEAHNMYLNFLLQHGYLGILFILQLVVVIPFFFVRAIKASEHLENSIFMRASFWACLSFLLYGLTWSTWGMYGVVRQSFHFYTFIGLYFATMQPVSPKSLTDQGKLPSSQLVA